MRIYLDNCVFNRPFDDQSHLRVRLEPEAKLYIQSRIKQADCFLSTDDKLLKRLPGISQIAAMNPINFIGGVDEYDYRH